MEAKESSTGWCVGCADEKAGQRAGRTSVGVSEEPVFAHVGGDASALVDVVFVHGLTGDPNKTWTNEAGDEFWPGWLVADVEGIAVHTLGYPASLFEKWFKKEMDMFERAGNVLERFAGKGVGERPIAFVAHSLGGILTKMVLRKSCEAEDEDWRRVAESTKLVIFLSTPHTGAGMANVINAVPRASKHVKLLANEVGSLEDLNDQYRTFANGREDLATAVYYEKHATGPVVVVARESADPGVVGAKPVPLDKDHVNICKPLDKEDIVYLGVKRHIQKVVTSAQQSNADAFGMGQPEDYEQRSPRDRRDLLEKLMDAGREHEYGYANDAQNRFARGYTKSGLLAAAREDHDVLLSEVETRFVTHVYHPLICRSASDQEIRDALQASVIDPLANRTIGRTRFNSRSVLSALYFLTEQCYIRWDPPG